MVEADDVIFFKENTTQLGTTSSYFEFELDDEETMLDDV